MTTQLNATVATERKVAAIGCCIARHAYPHSSLSGHQKDTVGIHATKGSGINGVAGRIAAGCDAAGNPATGVVPAVGAGIHAKIRHVDLTADGYRAADQVENLLGRGINAAAVDLDITLADIETGQAAIAAKHRQTGSQCHPVCIDETTARAANTVWIGYHHIGLAAQHFGKTGQRAAAGTDYLIENQASLIAKIDVGVHLPGQLRLTRQLTGITVIEHQALAIDVVLSVLVAGNTSCISGGDIHYGGTVGHGIAAGIAAGRRHTGLRGGSLSQQAATQ